MKTDPTKHTQAKQKRDVFTRTLGGEWGQENILAERGERFYELTSHGLDARVLAGPKELLMSIGRCAIAVRPVRAWWRVWEKPQLAISVFYDEQSEAETEAQLALAVGR